MSLLHSYVKVKARERGRALPRATVRHVHLAETPMVFVPLRLAGEAAAPLGAMVGTDPARPTLLVVPQPRNRDLRFQFLADLGAVLLPYIDRISRQVETVEAKTPFERCLDAPQIVVPSPGGVEFAAKLGRSSRFRRTTGPYAVDPAVPMLGRWLTFLAEQSEFAGSSLMVAMTDLLTAHWVTGQSAVEDGDLAALLGWIDPPEGLTGPEAAALADDPLTPPAGPDTHPEFDRQELQKAIEHYDATGSAAQVEEALHGQLRPTWDRVWQAIGLLAALKESPGATARWERDRVHVALHRAWIDGGGLPQGKRDSAVAAAKRLARLEAAQQSFEAARAFDDPLVMAEYRADGVAFAGEVVAVDLTRRIVPPGGKREVPRPLVTIETSDPVRLAKGKKVRSPSRPRQSATIADLTETTVTVQIDDGMGRGGQPAEGSVPAVGTVICYTELDPGESRRAPLPPREETPWTHGGPPPEYVPTDDDAAEPWS